MKKRHRLLRRGDFTRLVRGRRLFAGAAMLAFVSRREAGESRVGVTTSKGLGGAVARNRARRRLREAARLELLAEDSALRRGGIGYDVVLIARTPALSLPMEVLRAEARSLLDRLPGVP